MTAPSEETIERFVRYPETLSSKLREIVARQIESNPTARRLALFYTSFYDELDGRSPSDATSQEATVRTDGA